MRKEIETLGELLTVRETEKDAGIIFIEGLSNENHIFVSYHDLYWKSLIYLGFMQQAGLQCGDMAIFQIEDNKNFIVTLWACILGGIVPVPIPVGTSLVQFEKFFNVLNLLENVYIFTSDSLRNKLEEIDTELFESRHTEKLRRDTYTIEQFEKQTNNGVPTKLHPQDLAFIQFSSGSTGSPKGVMLTHENLLTNMSAIVLKAHITARDKSMSWLPLTHDMGIIGFHMTFLYKACTQYIIPTNFFVKNPIAWMNLVDEYHATIISSPNFGYKLFIMCYERAISRKMEFSWDFSSVRLIFNGAEPISVETAIQFMKILEPYQLNWRAMYFVYGMAEACLGVSFPEPGTEIDYRSFDMRSLNIGRKAIVDPDSENSILIANCGSALPYMSIRITDTNGILLDNGYVGRIQIKGKNVTEGYYNATEYSNRVIDGDGWLTTGDIGFIIDNGLYITGREKDIIIINGLNYYANEIEEFCEKRGNVKPGKVAACALKQENSAEEVLGIFIEYPKNLDKFKETIWMVKSLLSKNLGIEAKYVLPIEKIPKTTSGKVQRHKIVEQYNEHQYHELINLFDLCHDVDVTEYNVNTNQIESVLCQVIADVLEIKEVKPTDNLTVFGASSIKAVQINERINELYPNVLQLSDLYQHNDIQELAEMIVRKTKNSRGSELRHQSVVKDMDRNRIAITGIDINLPGADNLDELRNIFINGIDLRAPITENRLRDIQLKYPNVVSEDIGAGLFLDSIDNFDYEFFKITPKEAALMNPAQRLFLQSAYRAIQDAGYTEEKVRNSKTGVFLGYISDYDNYKYKEMILTSGSKIEKEMSIAGNLGSITAGRVSNFLDLKGPCIVVDTACSSSLSALYLACQSIKYGDCDAAVVGGIRIKIFPIKEEAQLGIESESNILRAFDENADGTIEGEGCITIFVKDYQTAKADGDSIYAVILGGALNQDGRTASQTSPSADSQSEVICEAWRRSGISPEKLDFIETHGTGTKVGDIIELEGLKKSFDAYSNKKQYCTISSGKGVFGHTYDLAGLLSVVKMVLQLKYKEIYSTAHLKTPNSKFDFINSALILSDQYRKWENSENRICGISSFGFSGTNCHMILEEAEENQDALPDVQEQNILYVTAKSTYSLISNLKSYIVYLRAKESSYYSAFCRTVNQCTTKYDKNKVIILSVSYEDLCGKIISAIDNLEGKGSLLNDIYVFKQRESIGTLSETHSYFPYAQAAIKNNRDFAPEYNNNIRKVHIPTYRFQRLRAWYECANNEKKSVKQEKLIHHLIWEEGPSSIATMVYTKTFIVNYDFDSKLGFNENYKETDFIKAEQLEYMLDEFGETLHTESMNIIYFAANHEKAYDNPEALKHYFSVEVAQLTRVLQKLDKLFNIHFVLLLKNSVAISGLKVHPEIAVNAALVNSAAIEMPQIHFSIIDYDEDTDIGILKKSLLWDGIKITALRGNICYFPHIKEKVAIKGTIENKIKKNGKYLITGGSGALGTKLAKYLTEKYDAEVILIGRKVMLEMEEQSEKIIYISCDISDDKKMSKISKYFEELNGIFHLAGTNDGLLIANKTVSHTINTVAPKIFGLLNLLKFVDIATIDFMMMFSSGLTICPEPGQSDYVMANQYLDAYADSSWNSNNKIKVIDLPVIKGRGMAEIKGYQNENFYALDIEKIPEIIEQVLNESSQRVIVGKFKSGASLSHLQHYGYNIQSPEVISNGIESTALSSHSRIEIQSILKDLIHDITGLDIVDPDENFFEEGVDSIVAVRLHKSIEEVFPGKLSVSQIFSINSLNKLIGLLYTEENKEDEMVFQQINSCFKMVEKHEISVENMVNQIMSISI